MVKEGVFLLLYKNIIKNSLLFYLYLCSLVIFLFFYGEVKILNMCFWIVLCYYKFFNI